ncbi:MAG TPA: thiamine-phosphate kinase [Methanothermobacter sp.]|nr:thiamine-phosphate kinase [Methanothermobacter sp.]HPQ04980.1 thiamine-phosphate kinase [Methanothermobacter sp.]HPU37098.1 thiamine-phosphate kinase [Methanothermobacter sp.]
MKMKISDLGEKKLIERIISNIRFHLKDFHIEGLGDDAALIDMGKEYIVATSDLLRQTSHFPKPMTHEQMGWKSVTVNVSDLAAMGAEPLGFLISMGLPSEMKVEKFDELLEGILKACHYYKIPLIGGDTNEADEIILAGAAIGRTPKKDVLLKKGSREGDLVAVTGPLGLAAAGIKILLSDKINSVPIADDALSRVLDHALKPVARLKEALIIAKSHLVNAATDITDGLVSELNELINASPKNLGIRLYEERIPIPPEVEKIAEFFNVDPIELGLYYGEDFELLFTIPQGNVIPLQGQLDFHIIGEVTNTGIIEIIDKERETYTLPVKGYEHLRGWN